MTNHNEYETRFQIYIPENCRHTIKEVLRWAEEKVQPGRVRIELMTTQNAIFEGRVLLIIEAEIILREGKKRGPWGQYMQEAFPYGERTAQRYKRLGEHIDIDSPLICLANDRLLKIISHLSEGQTAEELLQKGGIVIDRMPEQRDELIALNNRVDGLLNALESERWTKQVQSRSSNATAKTARKAPRSVADLSPEATTPVAELPQDIEDKNASKEKDVSAVQVAVATPLTSEDGGRRPKQNRDPGENSRHDDPVTKLGLSIGKIEESAREALDILTLEKKNPKMFDDVRVRKQMMRLSQVSRMIEAIQKIFEKRGEEIKSDRSFLTDRV
jgi:hypothetical protein